MPVLINQEKRIFTLQTANTSYQMQADELGYLLHLYYGPKTDGEADYILTFLDRGFSGNPKEKAEGKSYSLDVLPQEYPFKGGGDYRSVAFCMENADGTLACDLRYRSYKIRKEKYSLPGLPAARADEGEAETLEILLADDLSGVEVRLLYGIYEAEDIITRSVLVRNGGKETVVIRRAASNCLDRLSGDYDLIHFHGRHTMERQFERTPVGHAMTAVGSRRGMSSHDHNPAVILAAREACETAGEVYGSMLAYSGGFFCESEKDRYEQTRLVMGMTDDQFAYPLKSGEELAAPECILCFTNGGFRTLTHKYHDFLRKHVIRNPRKGKPAQVLINSWEAAYFDFDKDTIFRLADGAAELGMDLLVMDDGWFGDRRDDFRGLGDWTVNEEKLGCSLGELIAGVEQRGLNFGIWVEPEMVNENSDLYRAHPDWALKVPGRNPVYARNQLVLDFSRKEVRDSIFSSICTVLDQGRISYLKWDYNRSIADLYSTERVPGKILYDYILGLYEFLEMLEARYPELVIEGCSGGGGRFDAGMLAYTPQIWCSDNTDAADRLLIQYGTSFFYPVSSVGAHVSAVPNHQTGRIIDLKARGITAMAGTFGYELDPSKLSEKEKEEVRCQIRDFRRYAPLIADGDYYRLSDPHTDGIAAWAFAAKDGREALLNYVVNRNHAGMDVKYIRLAGLEKDRIYRCVQTGREYPGSILMGAGIPVIPEMKDYASGQYLFTAVSEA